MPDVSLVLALHQEGPYLPRTLLSLAEAAEYARGFGIVTELVAVLDRADDSTVAALANADLAAFEQGQILHADHGSLGPTRNTGCQAATGRYILLADGDDLISFNTIERMFHAAERLGPGAVLIPKFVIGFGSSHYIVEYFDLDQVTPLALLRDNPFVSRIFFDRSLCGHLAYEDMSLTAGYAYEDWHFNCEAVAHGYTFHAVPETILFYRQRPSSLVQQANRISVRQIPPAALFRPERFRQICGPWIERLEAEGDRRSSIPIQGTKLLHDPICRELLLAGNWIEPAILPSRLQEGTYANYLCTDLAAGVAYGRLCERVGNRRFSEIFLLPFLTTGGADRYVLDIIDQLHTRKPDGQMLIVFGEPFERYAWLERLPPGCLTIDLCAACPELPDDDRDLLCLKLLQSCAPDGRLHLRSSIFGHRFFARFAPVLAAYRPVYYRFSDGRNSYGDLTLLEPSPFQFVTEHIDFLHRVVCDNARIIAEDQRRFGFMSEKWRLLPARVDTPRHSLESPAARARRAVLWASRLDSEKRPELLMAIARLLARRLPDVVLDVFGAPTLDEFDLGQLTAIPSVRYRGIFHGLPELDVANHDCFVYTSRFDGLPNMLLEMMAAGIPIVAPDVGGIGEVIFDHETGVLINCTGDDAADAERYVAAIGLILTDPALCNKLVRQAFALVCERHSPARYAQAVADALDLAPAACSAGDNGMIPEG